MHDLPFRFEFGLPEEAELGEPPPEGGPIFDGEVVRNLLLDSLLEALGGDRRWSTRGVAAVVPYEPRPEKRIVVWVDAEHGVSNTDVQTGVCDIVSDVIADARLVSTQRTAL